jgi:hypothetical protein
MIHRVADDEAGKDSVLIPNGIRTKSLTSPPQSDRSLRS